MISPHIGNVEPENPVFVLGLGAQKAGTTSLFNVLASHERFSAPIAKEMHIWDRRTLGPARRISSLKSGRDLLLWAMEKLPSLYFYYFTRKIRGSKGKTFTGDFTPRYQCLQSSTLNTVVRGFERRGIKVKGVLILRYPAHRVASAALMAWRRSEAPDFNEYALSVASSQRIKDQTDYVQTLLEIADSTLTEVFVSSFELLFLEQDALEWDRLSRFLGVRLESPGFKPQNGTLSMEMMDPEILRTFEKEYEHQTDWIEKNFPAIFKSWSNFV